MAFERNTVVWASAGTGKTRRLVEAYLELIESGVDPSRIVAITFTEKAAAEMRYRIRSSVSSPRLAARLAAAPIATIHGLCGLLLREHGPAMNIDPGFSILNEQRSLELARAAVVDTLRTEIRAGHEGISTLFADFGLERLTETVVAAIYWLNSLGKDTSWLSERVSDQQVAAGRMSGELAEYFDKYGNDIECIGIAADQLDASRAKHPLTKRDDPRAALARIGQVAGVETTRQLTALVSMASTRFQSAKRALNVLDFDDLLLGVHHLLRGHDDIRRHYQDRFDALLVDEFQDTDEVQAAIIERLAEDPSGERRFKPGKLIVAGDPKQSIYRFRRARVTVFFRILHAIVEDGGVVEHLQENWRSAAPIAQFANRLSESMMDGAGKGPIDADDDDPPDLSYRIQFLPSDRLIPRSAAPCLGITYVTALPGSLAGESRDMEAEAVARLLQDWKGRGTIGSWKETAMLFRTASNMERYIDALEAHGIPVYVVQGTSFYAKTEVSDLIAVLELILHPADPLLRATVLSSSLVGVELKDLLAGQTSTVLDKLLEPWIEMRDRAPTAEILLDVIRKTDFDAVMMAQRNGPQRVANIGKLIEITRELEREGTNALDEVVRFLRERAVDPAIREPEAQIAGEDDDVVRLMTVHQSKGLEFDVVVLPDLAAKTARPASDRTFFSDRWGILAGASYGLHRKPLPHSLILAAKNEEEDQQYEEEKRLLYVAVTRARRKLVLGEGFAKNGGPWAHWVRKVVEGPVSRSFKIDVVPASLLNEPEQLRLLEKPSTVCAEAVIEQYRRLLKSDFRIIPTSLDLTTADLVRVAGLPDTSFATPAELDDVFDSKQWKALEAEAPDRDVPFVLHLDVSGRNCWIHGRIDALVFDGMLRVIAYKNLGEIELMTHCLAAMKSLGQDRAAGELWIIEPRLKIVRKEYTREEAENRLRELIVRRW